MGLEPIGTFFFLGAPMPIMKSYSIRRLEVRTLAEAQEAVRSVQACEESVPLMAPKLLHLVLHIKGVRTPVGNILKQEALSLGAEAAVSQWTVNCAKPTSDVVLAGTLKQLRKLAVKLKMQSYGLPPELAKDYLGLAQQLGQELAAFGPVKEG